MKSMTLLPMTAVATATVRPRTFASYVTAPETFGDLPMAGLAHRGCTWSSMTAGTSIRSAAKALFKANGTRRLWEPST